MSKDHKYHVGQPAAHRRGVSFVQGISEAWAVSRGCVGLLDQPPTSSDDPPGLRHAAGSRQPGPSTLQPSLLLPPSPSPSRLEPGLGHPERDNSRPRRGVGRRQGNRGYARRAEGPRSEFEDSRWGSARCHPPASLQCSGPTAAASTRRTAAQPWPRSHPAPRTRAPPRSRPPASVASGRTRGLQDPGACQHRAGDGPIELLQPGTFSSDPSHSLQSVRALRVPCGISLPPSGSPGKPPS